jgi:hypothetical protein
MPIMTGLEVIQELKAFFTIIGREKNSEQDLPLESPTFAMFSAHSHRGFREYIKERGVDFILDKTPCVEEISKMIITSIRNSQKRTK